LSRARDYLFLTEINHHEPIQDGWVGRKSWSELVILFCKADVVDFCPVADYREHWLGTRVTRQQIFQKPTSLNFKDVRRVIHNVEGEICCLVEKS